MNYLDLIRQEIESALALMLPGERQINFSVEIPALEHGDATTNVCLVASKVLGKNPKEIGDIIIPILQTSLNTVCENIEFKNPGFINFSLKKEFIRRGGKLVEDRGVFANIANYFFGGNKNIYNSKYFDQKVLVEHTSVNLFKPFTVGHLMTNFTGEFVGRAIQEMGGKVISISYPSDKSIGIAKAIWSIKKDGGMNQEVFKKDLNTIVKYLGQAYVNGVNAYKDAESNPTQAELIRDVKNIANNIFADTPSEDLEIFNYAKEKNLEYFKKVVESLNSSFSNFIFESEAGIVGKKIVTDNTGEGKIFQNSEGAVIYVPGEDRKDINTSVFINSEGNPTYLAKDIGLLDLKFEKYSPLDLSIYIVDNEQIAHFKTVFDAASKINHEWSDKSLHLSHGRMTFKGQKMSSRLGGVPNGEEVIDTVLEAVKEKSGDRNIDEQTQREIALSALRIAILRAKPGVNIDFDPDKALSFEGDSGPYLCYTSARLHSLLQKGKENNLLPGCQLAHAGGEINLERKLLQFENILKTVADEIAPQKLVTYLFELCGEFNHFYNTTKIIGEDRFESEHYLYVVQKTLNVLTKGLHILGIQAPDKM